MAHGNIGEFSADPPLENIGPRLARRVYAGWKKHCLSVSYCSSLIELARSFNLYSQRKVNIGYNAGQSWTNLRTKL